RLPVPPNGRSPVPAAASAVVPAPVPGPAIPETVSIPGAALKASDAVPSAVPEPAIPETVSIPGAALKASDAVPSAIPEPAAPVTWSTKYRSNNTANSGNNALMIRIMMLIAVSLAELSARRPRARLMVFLSGCIRW
ncbi:MAG TPA: hypothetical protein PLY46_01945, partial [Bacteroidales bacterium]|nr:hypothetical protein [Bacteroidales bacterium]